jgi:hypothetical protein
MVPSLVGIHRVPMITSMHPTPPAAFSDLSKKTRETIQITSRAPGKIV